MPRRLTGGGTADSLRVSSRRYLVRTLREGSSGQAAVKAPGTVPTGKLGTTEGLGRSPSGSLVSVLVRAPHGAARSHGVSEECIGRVPSRPPTPNRCGKGAEGASQGAMLCSPSLCGKGARQVKGTRTIRRLLQRRAVAAGSRTSPDAPGHNRGRGRPVGLSGPNGSGGPPGPRHRVAGFLDPERAGSGRHGKPGVETASHHSSTG